MPSDSIAEGLEEFGVKHLPSGLMSVLMVGGQRLGAVNGEEAETLLNLLRRVRSEARGVPEGWRAVPFAVAREAAEALRDVATTFSIAQRFQGLDPSRSVSTTRARAAAAALEEALSASPPAPSLQGGEGRSGEKNETPATKIGCIVEDLAKPYRPRAIHYEQQDVLEYVSRDIPTVARNPCHASVDILLDMATREPIGWRIYGWSKVAPVPQPVADEGLVEKVALLAFAHGAGLRDPADAFAKWRWAKRVRDAHPGERNDGQLVADAYECATAILSLVATRAQSAEQRVAVLEGALADAALHLEEAANLIRPKLPGTAGLFDEASKRAHAALPTTPEGR